MYGSFPFRNLFHFQLMYTSLWDFTILIFYDFFASICIILHSHNLKMNSELSYLFLVLFCWCAVPWLGLSTLQQKKKSIIYTPTSTTKYANELHGWVDARESEREGGRVGEGTSEQSGGWAKEWVSERVSRVSEWVSEWVREGGREGGREQAGGWVAGRMSEWASEWLGEWLGEWLSEKVIQWINCYISPI